MAIRDKKALILFLFAACPPASSFLYSREAIAVLQQITQGSEMKGPNKTVASGWTACEFKAGLVYRKICFKMDKQNKGRGVA